MKIARSAKIAKSPKVTAALETAPICALAAISFGGSCGNIFNFFGACGITDVFRYADTACPDLLCLVAAREIIRDKRLSRRAGWPIAVLVIGIAMTLVLGFIGADKKLLASVAASWAGHISGLLPGAVLLLVLSILHRRDSGTEEAAGTRPERRKAPVSTGTAIPKADSPVPASAAAPVPAEPAREVAASTAEPAERSFEDLLREARAYRDELAKTGERPSKDKLRLRLTVGSSKALELLRALKEDDQDDTREAVV